MQEWQVIFMVTDITNISILLYIFLSPFYSVVLRPDFDRSIDRELIQRAIVFLASPKRNAEIPRCCKNVMFYNLSSCINIANENKWPRGSRGKQAHWKLELTRTITYRNLRERKICAGNIFTDGMTDQ